MRKKILHLVGTLDVGGIEKWVVNMINYELENKNELDFYLYSLDPHKKQIVKQINLDENSITYTNKKNIFSRMYGFYCLMKKISPDVIHYHPGYSSGIYLFISKIFFKKINIVHSHSDRRSIDRRSSIFKKIYIFIMKFLINRLSDYKIAVSERAGKSLFYGSFITHYCGVPDIMLSLPDIKKVSSSEFKIYHIGRNSDAKNYPFIFSIAHSLREYENVHIYCMGAGLELLQKKSQEENLKNMHFLGFIENPLSHIYIHANVFIMPSLWEGLPLSVVEAQKCNVPCLVSDTITKECDIGMAEFLPLDVSIWQERILNIYK
ncbi:glycosyltransferase family 1 protein, partial [Escherichia coli]